MTQFDDRERAFETKFAHDEEMKFRVLARRNRLLGEWAARKMGLSQEETESYSKDVVRADFEEAGDGDVIRKCSATSRLPASRPTSPRSARRWSTRRSRPSAS